METKKNFSEMLDKLTENLSSVKGVKKESVYLPSIYEGCVNIDEKKQRRKKVRNIAEKFCSDILSCKDSNKLQNLIIDFLQFYKMCYQKNDYTISSIASKNTDSLQLENYKKMFVIIEQNKGKKTSK